MPDKPSARLAATLLVLFAAGSALGQTPPAQLVPAGTHDAAAPAPALAAGQVQLLTTAFAAARSGDWASARTVLAALEDPAAKRLLQWRIATADERAGFREMSQAVRDLQGWPMTNAMQRDAEYALADMAAGAVGDDELARFFHDFPAQSGEGKVAHAETLMRLGQRDAAIAILRDAWRQDAMRRDTQRKLIATHAALFTQDDTLERVDYLAFADQRSLVRDLLPLLPQDYRRLYEARLAIAGEDSDLVARLRAVPDALQDDSGLLYERARRLRRNGNQAEALDVLLRVSENPKSVTGRNRLWDLRHVLSREVLEAGQHRAAYDLVKDIGFDSGAAFADAEFLAGFIALRFLEEPAVAAAHFERLARGVSTPVSVSRGWYWTGRARADGGDEAGAREAYALAAAHPSAFYGQMAMAALDPAAALAVTPDPAATQEVQTRFAQRDLTQALHMLGRLGETDNFFTFARHMQENLQEPQELALLSDLANQYGQQRTALRVAKDARNRQQPIFQRAFPVAFAPPDGVGYAEPALTLAISRQETEFDPRAVSGANARGLMQLIPSTAQAQARKSGMDYREAWLLDDPDYNVRLGSAHLDDLIQTYNGSYIVAMAAYNAGPGRAREWIGRFGDPRQGQVDPIDWMEMVPFGETRNYIQRVLENVQVYRAQLNGGAATLEIAQDLRRGDLPQAAFR